MGSEKKQFRTSVGPRASGIEARYDSSGGSLRAAGTLDRTPLAHVFVRLFHECKSGTLVISTVQRDVLLLFRRGLLISVTPASPDADPEVPLLDLFESRDPYVFYAERDFVDPASSQFIETHPLALIARSLRRPLVREDAIAHVLSQCDPMAVLSITSSNLLERLALEPDEHLVVQRIQRGAYTAPQILRAVPADQSTARRVVYLLLITRAARLERPETRDPAVPRKKREEAPTLPGFKVVQRIRESLASIHPPADPLGFRPPSSSSPTDRLPGPKMSASSIDAKTANRKNAFAHHHQAQKLIGRGNYRAALSSIEEALRLEPADSDYLAVHGWCLFILCDGSEGDCRIALRKLNEALRRNPDHAAALYYKGAVLNAMGKHDLAIQHFTRCVRVDPNHIDAARELYRLRRGRERKRSWRDFLKKK